MRFHFYALLIGGNIGWDGNIWWSIPADSAESTQLIMLISIFIVKSLWVSFFAVAGYSVVSYAHTQIKFPFLQIVSVVLIALALFGLYATEKFPQIKAINSFWFYSFIVWGVFLQTMIEQLDRPIIKTSIETTQRKAKAG